jgi:hypothetical protein
VRLPAGSRLIPRARRAAFAPSTAGKALCWREDPRGRRLLIVEFSRRRHARLKSSLGSMPIRLGETRP